MKQGEIQQILTQTNLWWRNAKGWATEDPDLQEVNQAPYTYTAGVLEDLTPGGLYVLRGPRRVGKSVEVKRTIAELIRSGTDPRTIVHASVDGWRAGDLGALIDAARQLFPRDAHIHWFIDEITSIEDGWPKRIKWLRDNNVGFRSDTVVLTGSSARHLTESIKELAGRRGAAQDPDRVLLPMGFRSFARIVSTAPLPDDNGPVAASDLELSQIGDILHQLVPWLDQLAGLWERYLQVGGFPRAVTTYLSDGEIDPALLRSLLDVVHGDALAHARWSRTQSIGFLRRITDGLSSPTNYSNVAEDIGSSHSTVVRRFDDLRESFVVWPAYRELGLRPKLKAQPKIYYTDPIYTRLAERPSLDLTILSEQQIGVSLLRALEKAKPGSFLDFDRVLHHRTGTRKEIDFVGAGLGDAAIESKYVDGRWRGKAQTLRASRWRGIIATRTEINTDDPEILAIPTALLAWLIDS